MSNVALQLNEKWISISTELPFLTFSQSSWNPPQLQKCEHHDESHVLWYVPVSYANQKAKCYVKILRPTKRNFS